MEAFKGMLGNSQFIFQDKLLWESIESFELRFGKMSCLKSSNVDKARQLSLMIRMVSSRMKD